jgi:hypothetical protein
MFQVKFNVFILNIGSIILSKHVIKKLIQMDQFSL